MGKISSFTKYTIEELSHDLENTKLGDSEQIHEALIAALDIISKQDKEIEELKLRIERNEKLLVSTRKEIGYL